MERFDVQSRALRPASLISLTVAVLLAALFAFSAHVARADSISWTARTSAADNNWESVTFGNGLFVAVAGSGSGNRVMTSTDGVTWTSRTSAADNSWRSVTYGNGLFVAVSADGSPNQVMTSTDGITWTSRTAAANNIWNSVTFGNGLFVAVAGSGSNNRVMTSADGITWTSQTSTANNTWRSVTYANGLFVAVSSFGVGDRIMTSPDGVTWTPRTAPAVKPWTSVTWGGPAGQEKFVAVSDGSAIGSSTTDRVMTSPDGITWTSRTTPSTDDWWSSVRWGGPSGQQRFVAVASSFNTGNRFMTSPDGITWTAEASGVENAWFSVAWGGPTGQEKFVAVSVTGTGNRVMTSSFVATAPGAPTINSVTPGDGTLTVAFTAGTASSNPTTNYKYSTDGVTYTALSPASTTSPFTITGLTNGTAYSVTIKAVNSVGDSAASNAVSGTPAASSSGSSSTSTSSTSSTTTSTTVATTTTNTAPSASTIKLFLPKNLATITTETLSTGDDIELDAGGFQPAETVIVGFAEDPTGVSTVTASAAGRASATVEVPATRNGKVTAYLYGTSSKRGVKQTLTVADLPATGADTSLPTLYGVLLVVSGMLIVARRRLVR